MIIGESEAIHRADYLLRPRLTKPDVCNGSSSGQRRTTANDPLRSFAIAGSGHADSLRTSLKNSRQAKKGSKQARPKTSAHRAKASRQAYSKAVRLFESTRTRRCFNAPRLRPQISIRFTFAGFVKVYVAPSLTLMDSSL